MGGGEVGRRRQEWTIDGEEGCDAVKVGWMSRAGKLGLLSREGIVLTSPEETSLIGQVGLTSRPEDVDGSEAAIESGRYDPLLSSKIEIRSVRDK